MIVLAYNDAPALPALITGLSQVLAPMTREFEIIVVDDGSSDATPEVIASLSGVDGLRLVRHPRNRGVGAAFRTGVEAARFEIVGYIDGDGQLVPGDLVPLMSELEHGDAVSGIRAQRADPALRIALSRVYNRVVRSLFGLTVRDVNAGLKLYRRRFLNAVGPIESQGSFYDTEILVKGLAAGLRVRERRIRHLPRRHGRGLGASLRSIDSVLQAITSPAMRRYRAPTLTARLIHRMLWLAACVSWWTVGRSSNACEPGATATPLGKSSEVKQGRR
jgi:glycosyltransferase involved in cell wall biosynthesis